MSAILLSQILESCAQASDRPYETANVKWIEGHIRTGMTRAKAYEILELHGLNAYDYAPSAAFARDPQAVIEIVHPLSMVCGRHRYVTIEFDRSNRVSLVKIGKPFDVCL